MQKKEILTTFPISTIKSAAKEKSDGEKNAKDVAYIILEETAALADECDAGFLQQLRRAAGSLRLLDRSKRVLDLNKHFYRAYIMDAVQFLAAEVNDMEIYGNKDCYAKVSYAGNDKIYQGTVIFPAEDYYRFFDDGNIDESRPIYLIGTCVRKEYKKSAHKMQNRYTKQWTTTSVEKFVKRTKMLYFYLGNMPEARSEHLQGAEDY